MSNPSLYLLLESPSLISFLHLLLQPRTSPSTLVICSTRDQFLLSLFSACHPPPPSPPPTLQAKHPLLLPTLHLLATSRHINLAFVPTLPHLRAYLAVYLPPPPPAFPQPHYDHPPTLPPILGIFNLLALHRATGELSAQGLSRTLAVAVEAAARAKMQLVIGDVPIVEDIDIDRTGIEDQGAGGDPWSEQIPLLNGSLRFAGEQRVWAGRTVEAREVAGRWCKAVSMEEVNGDLGGLGG